MTPSELNVSAAATAGVITIGNFDGVHRGHQSMLKVVRDTASRMNRRAVVVTFDPHPVTVLKPDVCLPRLTSIPRRIELLKHYGADEVVVLPVTPELLNTSPAQFFRDVIVDRLQAAGIVEGPDFRFGKDRAGNTELLRTLCIGAGINLTVIDAVVSADKMISSTEIRRLLNAGRITDAVALLGHAYTITGVVSRGAGRGRGLGFPTANLSEIEVQLPSDGVYAGATVIAGTWFPVAVNIGSNPTFRDDSRKVECHIIDYEGELYDRTLTIEFRRKIRGLQTFESPQQLVEQIEKDVQLCRETMSA